MKLIVCGRKSVVVKTSHEKKDEANQYDTHESKEWVRRVRENVVGRRLLLSTPYGKKEMVYADYTASGRCLHFIENFIQKIVAPTYGNTHTDASLTGSQTSRLREEARNMIREALKAPKEKYAVLFTGTGSTGAIIKLVSVLGLRLPEFVVKKWNVRIPKKERPVVFISHFEHHSNELIWRESICQCVVIDEGEDGTPDLACLERQLKKHANKGVPLIGSFSAGSNVTGIRSPVHRITQLLHKFKAYAFFDFAGTGAYVDINMSYGMDAIFMSPHKLVGGPGSAGLLIAKKNLFVNAFGVETKTPSAPGGGTVTFVTRTDHSFTENIESREDAGTPAILQAIKAGLVFKVKQLVGSESIEELEKGHIYAALEAWKSDPKISLLGSDKSAYYDLSKRVSIFSFNIVSKLPNIVLHHNFVAALLNDIYGIQARGGCSCAGPYGSDVLGIPPKVATSLKKWVDQGLEVMKPGWCRVNFNYFIDSTERGFIIEAVQQIAEHGWKILPEYVINPRTGQFVHRERANICSPAPYLLDNMVNFSKSETADFDFSTPKSHSGGERTEIEYKMTMKEAVGLYERRRKARDKPLNDFTESINIDHKDIWFLLPSQVAV